jgi:hypothetical protein
LSGGKRANKESKRMIGEGSCFVIFYHPEPVRAVRAEIINHTF